MTLAFHGAFKLTDCQMPEGISAVIFRQGSVEGAPEQTESVRCDVDNVRLAFDQSLVSPSFLPRFFQSLVSVQFKACLPASPRDACVLRILFDT